jgi:hypothetical protein
MNAEVAGQIENTHEIAQNAHKIAGWSDEMAENV